MWLGLFLILNTRWRMFWWCSQYFHFVYEVMYLFFQAKKNKQITTISRVLDRKMNGDFLRHSATCRWSSLPLPEGNCEQWIFSYILKPFFVYSLYALIFPKQYLLQIIKIYRLWIPNVSSLELLWWTLNLYSTIGLLFRNSKIQSSKFFLQLSNSQRALSLPLLSVALQVFLCNTCFPLFLHRPLSLNTCFHLFTSCFLFPRPFWPTQPPQLGRVCDACLRLPTVRLLALRRCLQRRWQNIKQKHFHFENSFFFIVRHLLILIPPLSGRNSKASRSAVPGVEWIFGPVPDSDFSNETRNVFSDVPLYWNVPPHCFELKLLLCCNSYFINMICSTLLKCA